MLQLMTTPAQPAAAQSAEALPAENPATLPTQEGVPPSAGAFAVLAQALNEPVPESADVLPPVLADGGVASAVVAAEALPVETPEQAPEQAVSDPQDLAAEQWLLSMLGQQQTRIEAREGTAQAVSGTAASIRLPAAGGLSRQAQVAPPVADAASQQPPAGVSHGTAKQGEDDALATLLARLPGQAGEAPATALPSGDAASASIASSLVSQAAPGVSAAAAEPAAGAQAPSHLNQQLKLESPQAKWGEQMLNALRDNVELQLQQKVQSATIRLDPPELGSLEILLSHESGRLNVQISAANGDVARLLHNTSERLRQELVGQNFLQVNVQVSADSQSGQQGQQQARSRWQAEELVRAAAPQAEDNAAGTRQERAGRDVLITV